MLFTHFFPRNRLKNVSKHFLGGVLRVGKSVGPDIYFFPNHLNNISISFMRGFFTFSFLRVHVIHLKDDYSLESIFAKMINSKKILGSYTRSMITVIMRFSSFYRISEMIFNHLMLRFIEKIGKTWINMIFFSSKALLLYRKTYNNR